MKELFQDILNYFNVTESDFRVVDSNFYNRLSKDDGNFSLILGESYMAEEWKSDDLASFFRKVIEKNDNNKILPSVFKKFPVETSRVFIKLFKHDTKNYINNILVNNQNINLSKRVGEQHYDIPDILYEYMGDIKFKVSIPRNKETNQNKDFAFINFISEADLHKAFELLSAQRIFMDSAILYVEVSNRRNGY